MIHPACVGCDLVSFWRIRASRDGRGGAETEDFHVLLLAHRHPGTFPSPEKKAKGPGGRARPRARATRVHARRGARTSLRECTDADAAITRVSRRELGAGMEVAVLTRRGCSRRRWGAHPQRKNGRPSPSFTTVVRRRRTNGLPVKATQVSLTVSPARTDENRPIREDARTPPT